MADRLTRIAIVSSDRCKPKKCRQECKKSCPVVKTGLKQMVLFLVSDSGEKERLEWLRGWYM